MDYNKCSILELIALNELKDNRIQTMKDALAACELSKELNEVPDFHVLYTYLKRQIKEVL